MATCGSSEQIIDIIGIPEVVPYLANLLSSPSNEVCEQAIWALGNIAGESVAMRDVILGHGVLQFLLTRMQKVEDNSKLRRDAAWLLAKLVGQTPPPLRDSVAHVLPTVSHLLYSDDSDTIVEAACILSDFTGLSTSTENQPSMAICSHRISEVLEACDCGRLIQLTCNQPAHVVRAVLSAFSHIVTGGNDQHKQIMIDKLALPHLGALLRSDRKAKSILCICPEIKLVLISVCFTDIPRHGL